MIIWGFRWVRTVIGETGKPIHCKKCDYRGIWRILTDVRYFTLFFIRLFPTKKQVVISCPHCGTLGKISENEIDAYKNGTAKMWSSTVDKTKIEDLAHEL